MHILADITPLMTFLVKFNHIDPPRNIFLYFTRKFFYHFSQILSYDVILVPQNGPNWKLTKLTPLMALLQHLFP